MEGLISTAKNWMRRAAMTLAVMIFTSLTASATEYITDVMLVGAYAQPDYNNLVAKYTSAGWKATNWDLNHGIAWGKGDAILLLYKTAESNDGFNHEYITDFYIQNRSAANTTQTLNFMGRTYNLVPISDDSDDHFKGQYGDLNSHTGASTDPIHLYYTKETFADNRVITGITFNETKSGGVGCEGNTKTGYDLNAGCSDLTSQQIYMHLTTATAPVKDCYISEVKLVGAGTSDDLDTYLNQYAVDGWKVINYDLNKGINWGDGDGIYLLYKTAISPDGLNHGYITDFYIQNRSTANTTTTLNYNDRLYQIVQYVGSHHFLSQMGDLNSGTGASTDPIHLYCTTDRFYTDGRVVNGIYFNATQSGALGKEGGSTGYSLNAGTTGDNIYMHITTASTHKGYQTQAVLDAYEPHVRSFAVRGWAYDPDEPDLSSPIRVEVKHSNGTAYKTVNLTTDVLRADVNATYGITGNHGFNATIDVSDATVGTYSVKVFALDLTNDGETQIGSTKTLTITRNKPASFLEKVEGKDGAIYVQGWAYDPDEPTESIPIRVEIKYENGSVYKTWNLEATNVERGDVNTQHSITGTHGFAATVPIEDPGTYTVSVYACDVTGDGDAQVGSPQAATVVFRRTATIGDFNNLVNTSLDLPFKLLYNYSLTQQIYTSLEIGMKGSITAITFFLEKSFINSLSMEGVQIYMKHTDKSKFNDYETVPVSESDKVFEGTVTSVSGTITITLDKPFEYDGKSNLLVCCVDPTNGLAKDAWNYKFVNILTDKPSGAVVFSDKTVPPLDGYSREMSADGIIYAINSYKNCIAFTFTSSAMECELPYEYGFEEGLENWRVVNGFRYPEYTGISTQNSHEGGLAFRFFNCDYDIGPQYLISPRIIAGTSPITVSFYHFRLSSATTFQIGYSTTTSAPDSFTWVETVAPVAHTWTKYEHTFPAGTKYIAIKFDRWDHDYNCSFLLDEFCFMEYFNYAKPTNIAVSDMTHQSATLTWTAAASATGYAYQYRKARNTSWSAETTVNTTTVTLNNLSENTNYDFRVKALYEGNNASNYAYFNFMTEGHLVNLPYSDGFENGLGGWRIVNSYGSTGISKYQPRTGTYGFAFYTDHTSPEQYLMSPQLNCSSPMVVSFYYSNYSEDLGSGAHKIYHSHFYVGYSTTTKDLNAFTWGDETESSSLKWEQYLMTCPAGTKYIAIKWIDGNALFLDDLRFSELCTLADNADNTTTLANSNGHSPSIMLSGRTLYKDGDWNTLCLPFALDLTADGCPLAGDGVRAMTLNTATSGLSGSTLTLNFQDATSIPAGTPFIIKWKSDLTIRSEAEWNAFAEAVENGTTFEGKLVKLVADISVSTMVGTSDHPFIGTFDGCGHTLTVNLTANEDYCAPFRYVSNAAIKNLTVDGTITSSSSFAAGIIGQVKSVAGITSCNSAVSINSTISGNGYYGGIVGVNYQNSILSLTNCSFTGKMLGSGASSNGGFVGWNDGRAYYSECLFAPTQVTMSATNSCTFNHNGTNNYGSCEFSNCYYTQAFGTTQGNHTTATGSDLVALLGTGWEVKGGNVVPKQALDIVNPIFTDVTINSTASTEVSFTGGKFVGTYSPVSFTANDKSILFLGAENKLYYPSANMTLGSCRAYFQLGNGSGVKEFKLNFDGEDSADGIGEIQNSKFKIQNEGSWYSLDGRMLSGKPTQEGIYIIRYSDGTSKKVLLK